MKNVHILPTDKPSRLYTVNSINKLDWSEGYLHQVDGATNQNIYITNDEEIKQGDYGLSKLNEIINFHNGYDYRYYAKIILTTDLDLIKNGVQAIDDEFLEWFIKNPSCESVEVEDTCLEVRVCDCAMNENCLKPGYTIIIPQEEPCLFCEGTGQVVSSTTISGFTTCDCINIPQEEPKHITVKEPCSLCDGTGETTFSGTYTTQRKCDLCNGEKYWNKKILVEEPKQYLRKYPLTPDECFKQETLEEAAVKYRDLKLPDDLYDGFIAGAKWQQERMYSEGEVRKLFKQYKEEFSIYRNQQILNVEFEEWFEQFKKK